MTHKPASNPNGERQIPNKPWAPLPWLRPYTTECQCNKSRGPCFKPQPQQSFNNPYVHGPDQVPRQQGQKRGRSLPVHAPVARVGRKSSRTPRCLSKEASLSTAGSSWFLLAEHVIRSQERGSFRLVWRVFWNRERVECREGRISCNVPQGVEKGSKANRTVGVSSSLPYGPYFVRLFLKMLCTHLPRCGFQFSGVHFMVRAHGLVCVLGTEG